MKPSGSTKRLIDRLAARPGLLVGILRAHYGFTRRDIWRDAPAPRRRPADNAEVAP